MHIKNHVEELLEAIDAVLTINNIEKAVLAIRKDNTVLIDAVKEYIGSSLNIELKILKNRSAALGQPIPLRYYPAFSCFVED